MTSGSNNLTNTKNHTNTFFYFVPFCYFVSFHNCFLSDIVKFSNLYKKVTKNSEHNEAINNFKVNIATSHDLKVITLSKSNTGIKEIVKEPGK